LIQKSIQQRSIAVKNRKESVISLNQAHEHIRKLPPLHPVAVSLDKALGLVCAEDVCAAANCPSVDSSLKDGFAVISTDIVNASSTYPVKLNVIGALTAGDDTGTFRVSPGTAIRIMTGAPIPPGATSVLASEFSEVSGDTVRIIADARAGRNILRKGSDIAQDQVVLTSGTILKPAHLGLLAAAGVSEVSCYPLPKVAIAATGSELVLPGDPVTPGKVAASNMVTAAAELQTLGIDPTTVLVRDNLDKLQAHFRHLIQQVDVLITCGGVLDGDKDLTMLAMEQIGMEKIFHRVRIGPGKGACMGRVGSVIVFNLPGGPPSNNVALLLLALPGIRRMMGYENPLPQKRKVLMTEELSGMENWTQLVYSKVKYENASLYANPLLRAARLQAMAMANALIEIPEGCTVLKEGGLADAWVFS
jgi:molybdopterin molybdotransferase